MERHIEKQLLHWKVQVGRKPLILRGARQTGKTYSLCVFGRSHFFACHYVNFQQDKKLSRIFDDNLTPQHLIEALEFYLDVSINTATDILIFDEIQDCPRAITSLKYFCEGLPELALCCAGSLLGVMHAQESFPVGKVSFLDMRPMCFEEFLLAVGDQKSVKVLSHLAENPQISSLVHEHLMKRLKEYLIVGGLPAVVKAYASRQEHKNEAFHHVRAQQQELLMSYLGDFSKYSGRVRANEITATFESIAAQLAKHNKKFKASEVMEGGRFSRLQSAVDWLTGAGLIIKVPIVNTAEYPLAAFTKSNYFKLYLFDVGILGALTQLTPVAIYQANDLFMTFKGALCENYVAQEFLCAQAQSLYCWVHNQAEVDFIREINGHVYPIEVKSGISGKLKSLNVFASKYPIKYRTRMSARNLEINNQGTMHSYPLYLAYRFPLVNADGKGF